VIEEQYADILRTQRKVHMNWPRVRNFRTWMILILWAIEGSRDESTR
jgi:hypothetical protein